MDKIIHLTAKTKDISWEEKTLLKRNRAVMPDWEIVIHDDNGNEKMVKKYFPKYYDRYMSISKGVAKADIARVMYMYIWGGVYMDTDYLVVRNFEEFSALGQYKVYMPKSRDEDGLYAFRLGNALFMSEPEQDIWKEFLEFIFESNELTDLKENRIEKVTGPEGLTKFFFERIFADYEQGEYSEVCLPERKYFHPKYEYLKSKRTKDAFGYHLCWGSWRTKNKVKNVANYSIRKITAVLP